MVEEDKIKEGILTLAKNGYIKDILPYAKLPGNAKICIEALYGNLDNNNSELLKEIIGHSLKKDIPLETVENVCKAVHENTLLAEIKEGKFEQLQQNPELLKSGAFMAKAAKTNPSALKYAHKDLLQDPDYMMERIAENPECYADLDVRLKQNATYTMAMYVAFQQKYHMQGEDLRKVAVEMANDGQFKAYYGPQANFEELCSSVASKRQLEDISRPAVTDLLSTVTHSKVETLTQEEKDFNNLYKKPETTEPTHQTEDLVTGTFNMFKKGMRPVVDAYKLQTDPMLTGALTRPSPVSVAVNAAASVVQVLSRGPGTSTTI